MPPPTTKYGRVASTALPKPKSATVSAPKPLQSVLTGLTQRIASAVQKPKDTFAAAAPQPVTSSAAVAPASTVATASAPPAGTQAFASTSAPLPAAQGDGSTTPAPVVNQPSSASADSQAIHLAAQQGPAEGAEALAQVLAANPDPAYQQQVLDASADTLTALSTQVFTSPTPLTPEVNQRVTDALSQAAETAGPDGATKLAEFFVQGLPDNPTWDSSQRSRDFATALGNSLWEEKGALFGTALSQRPDVAGSQIPLIVDTTIDAIAEDFRTRDAEAQELFGQLQTLTGDLAALGATEEEIAAEVESFRTQHAQSFEDLEKSATKLASVFSGIALPQRGEDASPLLELLPRLSQTQAGVNLLADALEQQNQGHRTVLEAATAYGATLSDEERDTYLDEVAASTLQAAGLRSVEHESQGDAAAADSVLEALGHNLGLLRPANNSVVGLVNQLKTFRDVKDATGLASFNQQLATRVPDLRPAVKTAIGGLGVALGVAGLAASVGDLSSAGAVDQIKFGIGTTGVSAQALNTGLAILGRSPSLLAAKAVPGLTAVVSGISAIQSFSQGRVVEGAGYSSVALGAGLLLTGSLAPVGVTLIVAGTVAVLFQGEQDGAQEELKAAALERLGVPKESAQLLSDLEEGRAYLGQVVQAQSQAHGLTARAYLQWLGKLPPEKLEYFVGLAGNVGYDDNGKLLETSDSEFSLFALELVLNEQGLVPPKVTGGLKPV